MPYAQAAPLVADRGIHADVDVATQKEDLAPVDLFFPVEAQIEKPGELAEVVGPMILQKRQLLSLLDDVVGVWPNEGHLGAEHHALQFGLRERVLNGLPLGPAEEGGQALLQMAVWADAVASHVNEKNTARAIGVEVPLPCLTHGLELILLCATLGVPQDTLVHAVHPHGHAEVLRQVLLGAIRLPKHSKIIRNIVVAPNHEMGRMRQGNCCFRPCPCVLV
mmetsp:Transcript_86340/g.217332  ORF Transcript_86340/g.217332 Transcript_86340/m.217332 type:complete len:221 (+) Transcript_86340:410-1072(+)